MKKILITLLLIPTLLFSQEIPDTCFTEHELYSISQTFDSLYYIDSINLSVISQQKTLITDLEHVIHLDSLELLYRNEQVNLLQRNIDLYVEREKQLKPKWFKHPVFWFITGIGTAVLTSKLIVEVVQ